MDKLKDKKVVITGASSGIGELMAYEVAAKGGKPILLARSYDKLLKIAENISEQTGVTPLIFKLDVSDGDAVEKVFTTIKSSVGNVDILINNAGYARFELAHEATMETVESMFKVNVFGSIACTQAVLENMLTEDHGHIIFIASQAGKLATPKSSVYSATKHALLGFANSLRMELANTGIKVSTVNPGPIRTEFFRIADKTGSYEKNVEKFMLDPKVVAMKTIGLIENPKRELNLPRWMGIGTKLYQLFPTLVEKVAGEQFRKK
ncbi:short-chain dehydrogenase/reductase SDR [Evansella cellulosilytica DSM 2522]|uniref:Short-chain dehydrogenase/reductase SDR n=2 Tax=Evansella TaxID=2837485 RepID=E6TXV3_EVAC2|nr:short-chain dehydrogenase/reductase SDR [Evansella cellulosilytica DSM 2522]